MFFKKSLFYQIFVCLLVDSLALWEFRATAGDRMLSAFHDTVDSLLPAFNLSNIKAYENQVLLQLARLYIVSPERIILLITRPSIRQTCNEVREVLKHVNVTLEEARIHRVNNLYLNLYRGLDYYHDFICLTLNDNPKSYISDYHACFQELREDLIDCEGPPDWFEKGNESIVCKYFNDIINCNYVKAAMLCGLKPALMLRSFSDQVLRRILPYNCKASRRLPIVHHPMFNTISSSQKISSYLYSKFAIILITKYVSG